MTFDAYAPSVDQKTLALGQLVSMLAEDAMFALASGGGTASLDGLAKRRGEAYAAAVAGQRLNRMGAEFDHWVVELTRAMAPVWSPVWMPMHEVIHEKVTLEVGARGLRSLFSSKPSDKDMQRVKRLGTLAVRALRAVFAADGPIDPEEARTIAGLIGSLGLPEADAAPLYNEPPVVTEQLDVYGEVEPPVVKALVRGAWYAAAWDAIDPREEHVVRTFANKLAMQAMDVEQARSEAVARVDQRRITGLATVDAVRFVISDRVPGVAQLATHAGMLVLPRRFREEALAQIGHAVPVTLARRYDKLTSDEKVTVLGIAWAAALHEDPTVGRRALLRARHDRIAADVGEDGAKVRAAMDAWMSDVLAPAAYPMGGP